MGIPLNQTPISVFFQNLFTLQLTHSDKGYYYKNIIALLRNPLSKQLLNQTSINSISEYITKNNTIYITFQKLCEQTKEDTTKNLEYLFSPWENNVVTAIKNTSALIATLLESISYKKDALLMEYIQGFKRAFNKLKTLSEEYTYIEDIVVLERLYSDILSKEVIDLRGNPHKGLQIMGMPSGKSSNSYLPYDIKVHYDLPTYTDKDAVYTYHFYRLLHRAQNIEIIYTTSSSGLGSSEKSRLILQLEAEGVHKVQHQVAAAPIFKATTPLESIPKTLAVQEKIKAFFKSGISPSAIGSYLRNPLDFYS